MKRLPERVFTQVLLGPSRELLTVCGLTLDLLLLLLRMGQAPVSLPRPFHRVPPDILGFGS
jgi:hypothetical protein